MQTDSLGYTVWISEDDIGVKNVIDTKTAQKAEDLTAIYGEAAKEVIEKINAEAAFVKEHEMPNYAFEDRDYYPYVGLPNQISIITTDGILGLKQDIDIPDAPQIAETDVVPSRPGFAEIAMITEKPNTKELQKIAEASPAPQKLAEKPDLFGKSRVVIVDTKVVENPKTVVKSIVTEKPKVTEQEKIIEQPKAVEPPKAVEQPKIIETPKVVEQPKTVEKPKVVEQKKIIEQPKKVETPKIVEKPKAAEKTKIVEKPKVPETPKIVEQPKIVEKPKVVEKPKTTEVPKVQEAPKVVEKPKVTETPKQAKKPKPAPKKKVAAAPKPVEKQKSIITELERALRILEVPRLMESGYYVQIGVYREVNNFAYVYNKYKDDYPLVGVEKGDCKAILVGPLKKNECKGVLRKFKSYGFTDAFVKCIMEDGEKR